MVALNPAVVLRIGVLTMRGHWHSLSDQTLIIRTVPAFLACVSVFLTGCKPPAEIAVCETFIKEKIATPSSFRVVSTSSAFSSGAGVHGLRPTDQIKLVTIEYDAENQYGASVRATEACIFPLKGGALPTRHELDLAASLAAIDAKIRAQGPFASSPEDLIEKADALDRGERLYDCCIPDEAAADSHSW